MSRWVDGCFLLCHMFRGELLPVASDTARQSKEYLRYVIIAVSQSDSFLLFGQGRLKTPCYIC